ncbi:hypothetical protein [Micromonospora sp. KLBMP9576]|uniref:hypothetical protein n=1 Tax=Micromonospora sp. KLBMP9576 TaxID=3424769 RepID=UPI003D8BB334
MGLSPSEIRERLRAGVVYRVGMELPGLGPVAVTYDGTPRAPVPAIEHPVLLVLEANEFGIPREVWSAADSTAAGQRQQRVMRLMEALCDMLDPAYAVLGAWRNGVFYSGWFLGPARDQAGFRAGWHASSRLVGEALATR